MKTPSFFIGAAITAIFMLPSWLLALDNPTNSNQAPSVAPASQNPAPPRGLPRGGLWDEVVTEKTGGNYKTYRNQDNQTVWVTRDGTTEVVKNPANNKYETVLVENAAPSSAAAYFLGAGNSTGRAAPRAGAAPPDDGLPASKGSNFEKQYNEKTSSETRTVRTRDTDQVLDYNPYTSYVDRNPVTKRWEVYQRETNNSGQTAADVLSAQIMQAGQRIVEMQTAGIASISNRSSVSNGNAGGSGANSSPSNRIVRGPMQGHTDRDVQYADGSYGVLEDRAPARAVPSPAPSRPQERVAPAVPRVSTPYLDHSVPQPTFQRAPSPVQPAPSYYSSGSTSSMSTPTSRSQTTSGSNSSYYGHRR